MNRHAVLVVFALTAAIAPAQPSPQEPPSAAPTGESSPTVYTVQPGDSLSRIGRAYGVSVQDLRKANNLTGDLIVVDRKLIIPSPATIAITSPAAADVSQLTGENQRLRQQLTEASAKLAAASAKAAEIEPALSQTQTHLATTEAQLQDLSKANASLRQQFEESEKHAESLAAAATAGRNASEKVRQLEQELVTLQKKLAEADRQLAGRDVEKLETRIATLNEETLALRARLGVYETEAIPYTAEELALFRTPAASNTLAAASLPSPKAPLTPPPGEVPQGEQKPAAVVPEDDREVRTLCNLAITQATEERYDEAETTIRKALARRPDDGGSLAVLGLALTSQKRYEEAFDVLSRAAALKPEDAGIQTVLGVVLANKGQREQAEKALRKALQISPTQVDAHRNLALIYLTQQPPLVELARWHYQKSLAAGASASPELESQLAAAQTAATK